VTTTAPADRGWETLVDLRTSPGARPRDMSNTQLTAVRDLMLSDLFVFSWLVFDYRDFIPTIHGRLSKLLSKWGTPGYTRLMVQIPREFFKTSLCTRANSLWQVCRDPDSPVAIFNEKIDNSAKWLRSIKEVVASSEIFQSVFRDLLPPGVARNDSRSMPRSWKWSDTELLFQRGRIFPEVSITALGIGGASAGGHWPKIIKDDLISEDAAKSPPIMAGAIEWFDKSLYLERPALMGWDLVVCTPWLYNDLYAHILQTYDYKLYRRQALEADATGKLSSIFPGKLSTETLLTHQARDPYGFSAMMMCQPRPGKEQAFEPEWMRYGDVRVLDGDEGPDLAFHIDPSHYDPTCREDAGTDSPPRVVPLWMMEKALLWDPAPSEAKDRRREDKARNGLVMEGVDPWGRRYILETVALREDPIVVLERIFKMLSYWACDTLVPEEVNFSKVYRHWIYRECDIRGIKDLRILPVRPENRSKDTRIVAKIPDMKRGLYYFNRATTDLIRQELLEYPYCNTRDLLDAWGYDRDRLSRPLTSMEEFAGRVQNKLTPTPYSTRYF